MEGEQTRIFGNCLSIHLERLMKITKNLSVASNLAQIRTADTLQTQVWNITAIIYSSELICSFS
jgi:hypothetical protein